MEMKVTMSQPQPVPYFPPPTPVQSHSHSLFKIAIVVLLIAVVGSSTATAYVYQMRTSELNSQIQRASELTSEKANLQNQITQLQAQVSQLQYQVSQLQSELSKPPGIQLIWLTGKVNISPHSGTSLWIFFDNQDTGTLSSAVFADNSYQLWIVVGKTYTIKLYWFETLSGTQSCSARPGVFIPTTTTTTQDFLC